jgi:hypothetical protein
MTDDVNSNTEANEVATAVPPTFSGPNAAREAADELVRHRRAGIVPRPGEDDAPRPAHRDDIDVLVDVDRWGEPTGSKEPTTVREAGNALADYRAKQRQEVQAALALIGEQDQPQAQAGEQPAAEAPEPARDPSPKPAVDSFEAQQLAYERRAYAQGLQNAYAMTLGAAAIDLAGINSKEDFEARAKADPAWAQRVSAIQQNFNQVQQAIAQENARYQQQAQQYFEHYATQQDLIAERDIPELKDNQKAQTFKNAAAETLLSYGFAKAELQGMMSGYAPVTLRDSRIQSLIADATRHRMAKEAVRTARPAPLPPVIRPGAGGSHQAATDEEVERLDRRFSRSSSLKDAAALLAAQRRANR